MPKDLIEVMSKENSSDNKNGHIYINHMNNPKDECHDKLNNSQLLYGMKPNKIVNQEQKILLLMRPSKYTSMSVKHNGTTNTSTFLQCLFVQYLHEVVITILCL